MIAGEIHPNDEALSDFARAEDPLDAVYTATRTHMETGCTDCRARLLNVLRAIPLREPRPIPPRADWIEPHLQTAYGVRGVGLADLKLVCGAGDYELDVLVHELPDRGEIHFLGQITCSERVHEPIADLPVSLVEALTLRTKGSARTDSMGEFDLAAPREGTYGLRIGPEIDAPCVLLWEVEL